MTRNIRIALFAGALAILIRMLMAPLFAQGAQEPPPTAPPAQQAAAAQAAEEEPAAEPAPPAFRSTRPVIRVGQDLMLEAGSDVREVVLVFGSLTLEGRVARDVFVWFGDARIGPDAIVDGSLIVVGGNATIASGAIVHRDLAVIGGSLEAPPGFAAGGDHVLIGMPGIGQGIRGFVPWITRGLLRGRPIVPDLAWVWNITGIFFLLSVAIVLIFGQGVRASSDVVVARPFRTFLTGMLVLIVTGPLIVILAATIIGLVVVPVVIFGFLAAWAIGKVGVACGIGQRILPESEDASRFQALRSLVIGFVLIVLAYMVPILGLITWSLVSVMGLGAATIATLAAIRREYPRKPRPPAAPAPPPAPPLPSSEVREGLAEPPSDVPAGDAELRSEAADVREAHGPPPRGLLAMPRAQFLERTAAFAIDCVLIAIVTGLIDSRQDGMFIFLLFGYHLAFWAWQGTTLGGIIIGLRVVRTDGHDLRFVDALVRSLAGVFSIAVLAIGCFWMLFDPERQTWHDKIAGTYVVKVPRDYPLR